MPNAATSEKEPAPVNLSGRIAEFAVVSSIVLVVSLILWWRFLPLPHQDLNFYTEPAFMLAKFGKLAGPGSQYVDLTYQKGIYNYPPGHFLILAAWIRLWGFSADSLLAVLILSLRLLVGLVLLLAFLLAACLQGADS